MRASDATNARAFAGRRLFAEAALRGLSTMGVPLSCSRRWMRLRSSRRHVRRREITRRWRKRKGPDTWRERRSRRGSPSSKLETKTLKARLSKQERAHDTRRKVLLGAFVLHRLDASKDEEFSRRLGDWLRRELPDFLTRDVDKELFADLLKPPAGPAHNPIEAAPLPLEVREIVTP